ncbi:MAG: hypothetical protein A3H57_00215 [Candidatus Taylorbacteria bacterium RIFCSPLOWO2_02_FULL_43_11]|uniref:Uncharacterized protein n=1 Tax=Candidatus Taylorbacteria bacterium RIFCSPHIGHO2_02_FULL_43_32b TaxID=1802306 RepID=A0A1G2MFA7_9BACT|nr:MAG: hypothetical protein A2743_00650 [Candidatus Taylorbacteria bacterium RIFCSPHIGHO2_01_FULL_43_47]OHA22513.1 MAG: hypothetical protein A3C72_00255 [Candidatus Taylorbacteria bacterium RIFCSPHIGHO2_02_FULL_43_32b]OHA29419.1 MAG: hypothetical protein A3B08_03900 [Candidatus Taylorbacteria bacterium RIFCSPLOWO2_01_FULL_43_44]OHA35898.1 MAG: hypothetical protein A3H57_00215 [Candidatus Taylorbacteria bacterium RIFCSPLOWO2_02_FULL_43_11]
MKAEEPLNVSDLNNRELVEALLSRINRRTRVPIPNAALNTHSLKQRIFTLMDLGRQAEREKK